MQIFNKNVLFGLLSAILIPARIFSFLSYVASLLSKEQQPIAVSAYIVAIKCVLHVYFNICLFGEQRDNILVIFFSSSHPPLGFMLCIHDIIFLMVVFICLILQYFYLFKYKSSSRETVR